MLLLWGSKLCGSQMLNKVGHPTIDYWAMERTNRKLIHIKEYWDYTAVRA